jgi:hypothetical protein
MQQTISSPTDMMTATTTAGLTIGIDLGDQWSQFCLLDSNGTV